MSKYYNNLFWNRGCYEFLRKAAPFFKNVKGSYAEENWIKGKK